MSLSFSDIIPEQILIKIYPYETSGVVPVYQQELKIGIAPLLFRRHRKHEAQILE